MAAKKKTSKKNATAKKKAPARKKPVGKKKAAKKAPARKKAAKKKAVAKKAPARKKAAKKKAVAKKAEARKKPVAKNRAPARKTTAKKAQSSAKKTNARSSTKASTPRKRLTPSYEAPTSRRPIRRVGGMSRLEQLAAEREENPPKVKKMGARDREYFRRLLLNLRDHVVDEISFLAGNNLKSQNVATSSEDGTDNFNREFALKLVSSEQDLVYEIDEALNRIRNGQYGICQISGRAIERERLKVLPHARHCVEVQSELERGRTRYRPFGPTLSRSIGD